MIESLSSPIDKNIELKLLHNGYRKLPKFQIYKDGGYRDVIIVANPYSMSIFRKDTMHTEAEHGQNLQYFGHAS